MSDSNLNYKGMPFQVGLKDGNYASYFEFAGGCELAGSRGKSIDICITRTTCILDNLFLQPAVTNPRVGDMFDYCEDEEHLIINIDVNHLKLIPIKDASVIRSVTINDNTVFPYLSIENKVEDKSNEVVVKSGNYIIIENGTLMTNNLPLEVFVWKAKADEI